mmetsp:Transcript_8504/g.25509  ORF Transcript_8504/g.25509 Transcript_8504/m.25509 type:complete len:191 (-) Transcript_8504:2072-2644(-)
MVGSPESAQRRLSALRNHLDPAQPSQDAILPQRQASVHPQATASSTAAAGTRPQSSYERIHGQVSKEPADWRPITSVAREQLREVEYHKAAGDGIARITINRPEKRNAFTPLTVTELSRCFTDARDDPSIGVIILTGKGTHAFCSGGDQSVRGKGGYVGADEVPRLNVLDLSPWWPWWQATQWGAAISCT